MAFEHRGVILGLGRRKESSWEPALAAAITQQPGSSKVNAALYNSLLHCGRAHPHKVLAWGY